MREKFRVHCGCMVPALLACFFTAVCDPLSTMTQGTVGGDPPEQLEAETMLQGSRQRMHHKAEVYGTLWQNLQNRRSVEWPRPDTISCKNMRSRRTIHGQAFTPKRKKGRSWNKSVSKDTGFKHTDFERFQRPGQRRCQALPGAAKRSAQKWDTPRLCAEDMLTHCKTKVFSKSSKECKAAKNSKQKSQTTLKKSSVNLKKL